MSISNRIIKNYSIEPIDTIKPTNHGMGRTYIVETANNKYLYKLNERVDFIHLYNKVSRYFNTEGMTQSQIIKTKDGALLTEDCSVLYEFLPGETYKTLTNEQLTQAIHFMKKYNQMIKSVPFKRPELLTQNHWDKANSLKFIINELSIILKENGINNKTLRQAINYITLKKDNLKQKHQLIHTDLGPDNFLFDKDRIISIIDFTPGYDHELYSVSQFVYWNYLYKDLNINIENIYAIFNTYQENCDKEIIFPLLIKAALFRVIGPLLQQMKEKRQIIIPQRRIDLLEKLLSLIEGMIG